MESRMTSISGGSGNPGERFLHVENLFTKTDIQNKKCHRDDEEREFGTKDSARIEVQTNDGQLKHIAVRLQDDGKVFSEKPEIGWFESRRFVPLHIEYNTNGTQKTGWVKVNKNSLDRIGIKRNMINHAFKNDLCLEKLLESRGLKVNKVEIVAPIFDSNSNWYKILKYARWAPSPHNMQPWSFELESNEAAILRYDPQRLLPDTNPNGAYVSVGFGILLETMSIAAAHLGKDIEVKYVSANPTLNLQAQGPQKLATLHIVERDPKKEKETIALQHIIDRRTSRLPYDGVPVPQKVLQELSTVAQKYGHTMVCPDTQNDVDWVLRKNADAMPADMGNRRAREEVRSWMRFTEADAKKRGDGLAAYAMNAPAWQQWLFANVNWLFHIPGIKQLARRSYIKSMSGTATVTWLSGPFAKFDDWVQAGRMMARWWLTMTKYKVYLHPLGSIVTNPQANEDMRKKFNINEQSGNTMWMICRLGYNQDGQEPPQAQRIELEKMVTIKRNQPERL